MIVIFVLPIAAAFLTFASVAEARLERIRWTHPDENVVSFDVRVRVLGSSPPAWLTSKAPSLVLTANDLDAGEREAVALALETKADLLLMDDWHGRRFAEARGLTVVGTLGVLLTAGNLGLIDFEKSLADLESTSFYMSPSLRTAVLERWRSR